MKKYEEFTVNQSAIAGIQKLLAKEIEHELQPMMVGAQLFTVDTSLVGVGGKTKPFRHESDITGISTFGDGAVIPDVTSATQTTIDITPEDNLGGKETITADAIQYADYNVINDVKTLLSLAMAKAKDEIYWKKITAATDVVDEAVGTGDASTQWFQLAHGADANPNEGILKVTAVSVAGTANTLGTDYLADFYKGWLYFATAPATGQAIVSSYTWANGTTGANVGMKTVDSLEAAKASYKDLIAGKSEVVSAYGKPDVAILNQNEVGDLLADDKFLAAAASASGEKVILNGQISRAAGLDVLESQMMYEGVIAVMKKKMIGYDVYKEKLSSEIEKIVGTKGSVYAKIWEKSMPGITRPSLIALVFNCHKYTKKKV